MFISKAVIRQTQDANKALILQEIYEAIAAGQTTYSALEEIGNGYITNDLTMSSIQALAEAGYITIYESKWARDNKKIFKIELGVLSETFNEWKAEISSTEAISESEISNSNTISSTEPIAEAETESSEHSTISIAAEDEAITEDTAYNATEPIAEAESEISDTNTISAAAEDEAQSDNEAAEQEEEDDFSTLADELEELNNEEPTENPEEITRRLEEELNNKRNNEQTMTQTQAQLSIPRNEVGKWVMQNRTIRNNEDWNTFNAGEAIKKAYQGKSALYSTENDKYEVNPHTDRKAYLEAQYAKYGKQQPITIVTNEIDKAFAEAQSEVSNEANSNASINQSENLDYLDNAPTDAPYTDIEELEWINNEAAAAEAAARQSNNNDDFLNELINTPNAIEAEMNKVMKQDKSEAEKPQTTIMQYKPNTSDKDLRSIYGTIRNFEEQGKAVIKTLDDFTYISKILFSLLGYMQGLEVLERLMKIPSTYQHQQDYYKLYTDIVEAFHKTNKHFGMGAFISFIKRQAA